VTGRILLPRRRIWTSVAVLVALSASTAAALGWARAPRKLVRAAPSIRIVDLRPLQTSNASLRDIITHTVAIQVATRNWRLLPYRPGATARDNGRYAGHWRLYLDGHSLGDNFGAARVSYATLPPGTHWLAAELSNADSTSLRPAVWSEPVILHVPRVVRCWQTGWRGSPETGSPRFACNRNSSPAAIRARRLP
jgi:hypothetical protein